MRSAPGKQPRGLSRASGLSALRVTAVPRNDGGVVDARAGQRSQSSGLPEPGALAERQCHEALVGLRRVHGQLHGLIAMVEQGRDPSDVVTLLSAVTHALRRTGVRIVVMGMERCLTAPTPCTTGSDRFERLFLSL